MDKTTREIAELIARLRSELERAYGDDFSFTIMGRGQILGASNVRYGLMMPAIDGTLPTPKRRRERG